MQRKLTDLSPHPANPRAITGEGMEKMKTSLTDFKKMLKVRPVIVDEGNVILGGHQKVAAAKELGWKTIETRTVTGWSEDKKKAFLYQDNVHEGDWDWEKLFDFDGPTLGQWGLEVEQMDPVEWTPPTLERNVAVGVVKGLRIGTSGEEQYRSILEGLKRPDAMEIIERTILGTNEKS